MQIICIKRKQIRQKSYIARNLETFSYFLQNLSAIQKLVQGAPKLRDPQTSLRRRLQPESLGSLKTTRPPNVEPYMRLRYVQSHHRVQQAKPKHPVLIDVAKLP